MALPDTKSKEDKIIDKNNKKKKEKKKAIRKRCYEKRINFIWILDISRIKYKI